MKIKVELKTKLSNDELHRAPELDKLKEVVDEYSIGFKGAVVLHQSLYEYNYDTKNSSYDNVDKKSMIGHIESSDIENGKLFLIIDVSESLSVTDSKYICFFRSRMQTTTGSKSPVFDEIGLFSVDLIRIGENEDVKDEYLSEVIIQSD